MWDINKYRNDHESEEHWLLRKKFMETHKEKFPEDKLVCLAQVFFNIEFLGCRYPEKTMKLVAELSAGVADEHREKQKNKLKRTFVQASDAAGAKIKSKSMGEPPTKLLKTDGDNFSVSNYFVKPGDVSQKGLITKQQLGHGGDFPGFIIFENCNSLGQVEPSPVNILTHSVEKNKLKSLKFLYPPHKNNTMGDKSVMQTMQLFANHSKEDDMASSSTLTEQDQNASLPEPSIQDQAGVKLKGNLDNSDVLLQDYNQNHIIIFIPKKGEVTPLHILTETSKRNSCKIDFVFPEEENKKKNSKYCEMLLDGKCISSGRKKSFSASKKLAAKIGLQILQEKFYTIQALLKREDSQFSKNTVITKETILQMESNEQHAQETNALPVDLGNVGSKLMMKMGYAGGGLGKSGQGIINPIEASTQVNRTGIGHTTEKDERSNSSGRNKERNILHKILEQFCNSNVEENLLFSSEFPKNELNILCMSAIKLGLMTQTLREERGGLLVYKPPPLSVLMSSLLSCGGENENYRLISPKKNRYLRRKMTGQDQPDDCEDEDNLEGLDEDQSNDHDDDQGNAAKVYKRFKDSLPTKSSQKEINTLKWEADIPLEVLMAMYRSPKFESSQKEVKMLEWEADIPLEVLMAKYRSPEFGQLPESTRRVATSKFRQERGPFIIFHPCDVNHQLITNPIDVLFSNGKQESNFKIHCTGKKRKKRDGKLCEIFFNKQLLSYGEHIDKKVARDIAATQALCILQQTCYTIQQKRYRPIDCIIFGGKDNTKPHMLEKYERWSSSCNQRQGGVHTGILQPGQNLIDETILREQLAQPDQQIPSETLDNILQDFTFDSNIVIDKITFLNFTPTELTIIDRIAQSLELKTVSTAAKTHLVVYKRIHIALLLETLLDCGGENDDYYVVPPTYEQMGPYIFGRW